MRLATLSLFFLGFGASRSQANMIITATFDSSITSDPNGAAIQQAINSVIQIYETDFLDPINVFIKFQEMTTGLGQNSSFYANIPYSTYLAALTNDATSNNDTIALAHLGISTNNPVTGDSTINVKTANLKAIGISVPAGLDGTISLNTSITTPGGAGSTLQYSLMSTAEHEIDEVLGLGSSLPTDPHGDPFPEDLFRYDASGNRSFTTNGAALAYFSINGITDFAQFDNRNDGGDFGDWQSNPRSTGVQPKVQDAFATPGASPALGVELTALDVIGYNLATPEPSTFVLFGSAMLFLGGIARRRRHASHI